MSLQKKDVQFFLFSVNGVGPYPVKLEALHDADVVGGDEFPGAVVGRGDGAAEFCRVDFFT